MNVLLDYLNNLACTIDALQLIVFDDDSTEAHFKDGSSVQLSPCGSCYQYVRGDVNCVVPKLSKSTLRQRCCFATSETKPKVEFALFWRNHFAQRPYVPKHFQHLYEEVVHHHKDITSYSWPSAADLCSQDENDQNDNLMVSVSASEDLARLVMSKNQHFCEVRHLVKLSSNFHSTGLNEDAFVVETSADSLETGNCSDLTSKTRKYVWIKHIFPVSSHPACWKYPLSVALLSLGSGEVNSQLLNVNHAPQPISTICEKQFSHVWRNNSEINSSGLCLPINDTDSNGCNIKSIKSVWNNKVLYWILNNDNLNMGKGNGLEAWLPGGSVLVSTESPNYYYTHITFDENNPSIMKSKRVYSTTALPLDSSLKTVILRAIRLQSYTEQLIKDRTFSRKQRYCWQDDFCGFGNLTIDCDQPLENKLERLFENADIPNLGQFSAAKSSIQIVYVDGAMLYISLSQPQLNSLQKSNADLASVSCRILFANGQYMECTSVLQSDSHLSAYLKPACDWLIWLAKPKQQRLNSPFYSDTIFSREKLGMIGSELEKINRFNFLLEHSSFNSTGSNDESLNNSAKNYSVTCNNSFPNLNSSYDSFQQNTSAPFEVASVLKDTSQAINDIDSLISSLRSSS